MFPGQSHINPSMQLARRLARLAGADVTFSTAISAHRRMFSSTEEFYDGEITYIPYSNGYDDEYKHVTRTKSEYFSRLKTIGSKSLFDIIRLLAHRGRPVTLVIYSILLTWAGEVARNFSIPSALYWVQSATVFAIYFHYFHGYNDVITSKSHDPLAVVEFPGGLSLNVRDLPSFIVSTSDDLSSAILPLFKEMFEFLSSERQEVLLNTFDELERDVLININDLKLVSVGPVVSEISPESKLNTRDIFKMDEKPYIEWLDSKEENSVVYVSFGSISVFSKHQIVEIQRGLIESRRPYLWVVRKDNRDKEVELEESGENCMILEWCSQVKVLSHPAVGCFVTHCGWNSTLESLVCGVPLVAVPQWIDQGTNARLMEECGVAVRGELKNGVFEGVELKRCLEIIMGDGVKGEEIRRMTTEWQLKAQKAIQEGGSSDQNLRTFVDRCFSLCAPLF